MAAFRYAYSLSIVFRFMFWCTSEQYLSTRHASKTQSTALLNQKAFKNYKGWWLKGRREFHVAWAPYLPLCSWFQWLYSLAFSSKAATHSQNFVLCTAKTWYHSPDSGLELGLVTKRCPDVRAVIFTEQVQRREGVAVQHCVQHFQQIPSWNPWWPTAIQTAEQMLCWDTGNASPSAGIPSVPDRILYCGMPPHAMGGFEQKEQSRRGTASHGSTALSLGEHISHLKVTDCWRLHFSGTLAGQAHVLLPASRVRQSILLPLSSSCFPMQRAKVGYTQ